QGKKKKRMSRSPRRNRMSNWRSLRRSLRRSRPRRFISRQLLNMSRTSHRQRPRRVRRAEPPKRDSRLGRWVLRRAGARVWATGSGVEAGSHVGVPVTDAIASRETERAAEAVAEVVAESESDAGLAAESAALRPVVAWMAGRDEAAPPQPAVVLPISRSPIRA